MQVLLSNDLKSCAICYFYKVAFLDPQLLNTMIYGGAFLLLTTLQLYYYTYIIVLKRGGHVIYQIQNIFFFARKTNV